MPDDRVILGIDPGTNVTGYGIIGCSGNKMALMTYGIIDMTKSKGDHPDKLKKIFERVLSLIDEFHPDEVSLEAPFYGKNIQSMLKLGRAQGVAMAAALYRNIPIVEYAPKKVKMSITGNGNASKEQVSRMLETLLNFKAEGLLDATDGLALAVCHFFQNAKPGSKAGGSSKGQSNWKSFISENPNRLKKN
ncbi:MAG: crossover junction endodeoxyribonuclease RuvC [Bacteroidia bacterium]|nr:crossover junction endodeoxyribonuclease RuvC [Bacteroidia bacterium]